MPRQPQPDRPPSPAEQAHDLPPGFTLRCTLWGHRGVVTSVSFSPDGKLLASGSGDHTVRVWEVGTGRELRSLARHEGGVLSVSFSPDGKLLASGSMDQTVQVWEVETGKGLRRLARHEGRVTTVSFSADGKLLASGSFDGTVRVWQVETGTELRRLAGQGDRVRSASFSPNGKLLASGSEDGTVQVWQVETGTEIRRLAGHEGSVLSVSFSPDGKLLASGSRDRTVRVWEVATARPVARLEGHTGPVYGAAFSRDGGLLASRSADGTIRLWGADTWEMAAISMEPRSEYGAGVLGFHLTPLLATLGVQGRVIRVWERQPNWMECLGLTPAFRTGCYKNAKVVLVGDSGVGKTGLGLVLTGQPFAATESTHGRHVWTLGTGEAELGDAHTETRETLLWDLAGQPGYRLIHQLHLDEVAAALIVFDARSETDPLAGVHHWDRALRQAQRLRGDSLLPMRKLLVLSKVSYAP